MQKGRIVMRKLTLVCFCLYALPFIIARPAQAQLLHTWVASTGSDSANCDRPTPCATFANAYANTTAGGEITCVDSGDFGGFGLLTPISHSITINCENTVGTVSSDTSNAGILISLTSTTDSVVLKGLDVDGFGIGGEGCSGASIIISGGGTVHLQNMKINHLLGGCYGIWFQPSGAATLDISDSNVTDNGTASTGAGIYVSPQSAGVEANLTITRTQVQGNYFGIVGDGRQGGIIKGTISDSVVSGSTENGITAISSGSSVVFMIDQTKVTGNLAAGLYAGGSNTGILVRNTTVYGNAIGLDTTGGGALYTYGNNSVNGNTTNGAFTGTAGLQ
jgi:hypothetical protein